MYGSIFVRPSQYIARNWICKYFNTNVMRCKHLLNYFVVLCLHKWPFLWNDFEKIWLSKELFEDAPTDEHVVNIDTQPGNTQVNATNLTLQEQNTSRTCYFIGLPSPCPMHIVARPNCNLMLIFYFSNVHLAHSSKWKYQRGIFIVFSTTLAFRLTMSLT